MTGRRAAIGPRRSATASTPFFSNRALTGAASLPETTDASIAVYSSTGKNLTDAQKHCDDLGGTNSPGDASCGAVDIMYSTSWATRPVPSSKR